LSNSSVQMQITIKTLKNSVFKIESELDMDVAEFKKKIEEHDKECPQAQQKLIYQGKVMEDGKKLGEYNLTEKGFIVLMVTKAKVTPPPEPKKETPAATPATPATTDSPATTTTPTPPTESTATTPTEAATPAAAAPPAAAAAAPMFSESMVDNIAAMGFPRDQIIAALRAAFGNPDRAVDYLMNGIPENLLQQQAAPTPAAASAAVADAAPAADPTAALTGNELERIRNEPQFQQIRQIIRTNPQLLQQFIQQMSRSNPDLFRVITQNQEEFIRILNEPDASDSATPAATTPASGGAGAPAISRDQEGRVTLQVTEEERQAIDRLKQLGFPEDMVIQAYFACEKNEELAANFLLSNAFD